MFLTFTNEFNINFQIGSDIYKTGNGIISHTSSSLINEYLQQKLFHFYHAVQNYFSTYENELKDKGIITHYLHASDKKIPLTQCSLFYKGILN